MTETTTERAELLALIADKEMDAAEFAAAVGPNALAGAWAAGDVEFGRRSYSVTGRKSLNFRRMLVVEDGVSWTGPKRRYHKPAKEFLAEELPACDGFGRYVVDEKAAKEVAPGDPPPLKLEVVQRADALAMLALRVRLTDQGLGKLA